LGICFSISSPRFSTIRPSARSKVGAAGIAPVGIERFKVVLGPFVLGKYAQNLGDGAEVA
jgi:hypothetical protein